MVKWMVCFPGLDKMEIGLDLNVTPSPWVRCGLVVLACFVGIVNHKSHGLSGLALVFGHVGRAR